LIDRAEEHRQQIVGRNNRKGSSDLRASLIGRSAPRRPACSRFFTFRRELDTTSLTPFRLRNRIDAQKQLQQQKRPFRRLLRLSACAAGPDRCALSTIRPHICGKYSEYFHHFFKNRDANSAADANSGA